MQRGTCLSIKWKEDYRFRHKLFSSSLFKATQIDMLLRSSSTPVLGSLLSSFSESPNHQLSAESHTLKQQTPPTHHHHHIRPTLPLSCSSLPLTHSNLESSSNTFKRSISEGNLEGLAANSDDHPSNNLLSRPPRCSQRRLSGSFMETIPSFSLNSTRRSDDEESDYDDEEDFGKANVGIFNNTSSGLEASGHGIRFLNTNKSLGFVEEQAHGGEMYLARGLGVENIGFIGGGGNGGGDIIPLAYGRDGGDGKKQGAEEHYKNLVEENPGNPLFLRNYAQFLFESNKDLEKSEELYSRAILEDPGDGEVLAQYAKLLWELRHDQERALNYFERAVQAVPADSHVHAAYANFLWEIEEDEDDEEDHSLYSSSVFNSQFHKGTMATAST